MALKLSTQQWYKALVVFGLVVVALLLTRFFNSSKTIDRSLADTTETVPTVTTQRLAPAPFSTFEDGYGEIRAQRQVDLYAEVGGTVAPGALAAGSSVKAGQSLVSLDRERANLDLMAAEARLKRAKVGLAAAKKDNGRMERLYTEGLIGERELDQSRLNVKLADADLGNAQAQRNLLAKAYRDTLFTAPFEGVLSAVHVREGDLVAPGMLVATVSSRGSFKASLEMTERQVADLAPGLKARVTIDSLEGKTFDAKVLQASLSPDQRSKSYTVELELLGDDPEVVPGMVCSGRVYVKDLAGAFVVPEDALIRRRGETFVFMVEKGKAKKVNVEVKGIFGAQALLGDNTQSGEVVVDGHSLLVDGAELRIEGEPVADPDPAVPRKSTQTEPGSGGTPS